MKQLAISVIFLLLTSPVFAADKWDTTDKILVTAMWTARLADMSQTIEIYDNPAYYETGPIMKELGEDAIVPFFVVTAGVMHYVAHVLPDRWRTPFLVGANIGSWIPVINNRRIGVKFSF